MNQTQVLDKRPSLNLADLLHPSTLGRSNSLFPTCPTPAALIPRFDSAKLAAALAPVLGQALKEPRLPAIRHRRLTEPPQLVLPVSSQGPKTAQCAIPAAHGAVSNLNGPTPLAAYQALAFELPDPPRQFINVATLKALLERPRDTLLMRTEQRWMICSEDHRIDLTDGTQEYRLGEIQVYS